MTDRRLREDAAALFRSAHAVAGTAYAAAMTVIAAFAAWPIYADGQLVRLVAASFALALLIAAVSLLARWRWWLTGVVTVVALLVLGVVFAGAVTGPADVPAALGRVAAGAITGWKDLLTVDLPVGTYRNLLVPAGALVLVGTLCALRLSWRSTRAGAFAVVPALMMTAFGLLFGSSATSAPIPLGVLTVPAPRELATGIAALVVSLLWLSWRGQAARRAAVRHAAGLSGVRVGSRAGGAGARRIAIGAAMTVVAVVVGAAVAPAIAESRTRDVLRSGTDPATAISRAVTPLTDYRSNFTTDALGETLFTVTAVDGPLPARIRIATLTDYDGVTYRAGNGGGDFVRVPSRRGGDAASEITADVHIGALRGIWLPTFGSLRTVRFDGADAAARADGFYYDSETRAAVLTDGVRTGLTYRVTASDPDAPALDALTPSGAHPPVPLPDDMRAWIEDQDAGTGGSALSHLVRLLRERGYLSHALSVPENGAGWTALLGDDYVFQPSAAGHSLGRENTLFTQLLRRQSEVASGQGTSLVAAVGDDEQFAVAVSLIAEQLGFPARVVVGARLQPPHGEVSQTSLPVCDAGACTGADIAVWAEVRDASGAWTAVDATPQHDDRADTALTRQRDPENPTVVRPDTAQEVVPPDPTRQESGDAGEHHDDGASLAGLWRWVRGAAIGVSGLLIVVGPFLVVPLSKRVRRRSRRRAPSATAAMAGGWEEFVDTAVDHGMTAAPDQTRTELAHRFATPDAAILAAEADRAVFAATAVTDEDSARFWDIVEAERRRFAQSATFRQRLRAAVSLRSFTRGTAPRTDRDRRRRRHGDQPHPGEEGAPGGAHRA